MSKHTPGPWLVVPDIRTDDFDREYIAGYNVVSGKVVVIGDEGIMGDGLANATLIAAAPELLDSLKVAEKSLELLHSVLSGQDAKSIAWRQLKKCRAAISKALGEAP